MKLNWVEWLRSLPADVIPTVRSLCTPGLHWHAHRTDSVHLSSQCISSVFLPLGLAASTMSHAGIKSSYSDLWSSLRAYTQTRVAAVILLSFVLAVGFLLVILSCALWSNWLPLLVGA